MNDAAEYHQKWDAKLRGHRRRVADNGFQHWHDMPKRVSILRPISFVESGVWASVRKPNEQALRAGKLVPAAK